MKINTLGKLRVSICEKCGSLSYDLQSKCACKVGTIIREETQQEYMKRLQQNNKKQMFTK